MLFNVYVLTLSTTRKTVPSDKVFWFKRIRADTRTEALGKCLPSIREHVLPHVDKSIKYISVYAGRVGSIGGAAFRLYPIQIIRKTGEIRKALTTEAY